MTQELSQISEELFEKIRNRFDNVSIGDEDAMSTQDPQKARFYNFDYVSSTGDNFGNITISLIDQHSLKVYFSKNVSAELDDLQKKEWYNFLRDLRMFARRNMLSFDTRDIARSNLKVSDVKTVAKSDGTYDKSEVTEGQAYSKTPSGDYRNAHTGVVTSKPGVNPGEPSSAQKLKYYTDELERMQTNPAAKKSHIAHAEKMIRKYSAAESIEMTTANEQNLPITEISLAASKASPELIAIAQDLRKALDQAGFSSTLAAKKTMLVIKDRNSTLSARNRKLVDQMLSSAGVKYDIKLSKQSFVYTGDYTNTLIRIPYDQAGSKSEVTESSMYGNAKSSYQKIGPTKLILRHTTRIDDSVRGARTRRIESIFVETHDGERFRLPFTNLAGARAMGRHVAEGGSVQDEFGSHITKLVSDAQKMRKFLSGTRNRTFEDSEATEMIEAAHEKYNQIRRSLHGLAGNRGYRVQKEAWTQDESDDTDFDVEALKEKFVRRSFDDRLEEALPLVHNAYEEFKAQKTPQLAEFENWAENMSEGTWATPESESDIAALQELMNDVLPVGVDASNATGALYDILGDDELFDALYQYSEEFGPEADARQMVFNWLKDNMPDVLAKVSPQQSSDPATPTESVNESVQLNEYYSIQSDKAPFFHHSTKFLDSAKRELVKLKAKGVDADIYEISIKNGQKVSKKMPQETAATQPSPTPMTESHDMDAIKYLAGLNHKR